MAKEILGERYRLDEKISESANVTVYRAWDLRLRRVVAVKHFRQGDALSTEARANFQRTARALLHFEHPNVVMVHDGAVADDLPFLVLEWLPGRTLRERLAHGPLPVSEAVATVCALASAVERAQSDAVPALNLDAGTILFDLHGQPKLTQFEWQPPLGKQPSLVRAPDAASAAEQQVFALCVLLHEMLTGQNPFLASGPRFRASKASAPRLPRALIAILLRALAPQPAERFDSPRALAAALAPFAAHDDAPTLPSVERVRLPRPIMPARGLAAPAGAPAQSIGVWAAMLAVLLLMCTGALFVAVSVSSAQSLFGPNVEVIAYVPDFGSAVSPPATRAATPSPSPQGSATPRPTQTLVPSPSATQRPPTRTPTPFGQKPPPPPLGTDDRLYSVQVPAQSTLVVTIGEMVPGIDYDLYLYDAASAEVGRSVASGSAPEQIKVPVVGGRYTVRVHYFQGAPGASYDVRWQWLPSSGG